MNLAELQKWVDETYQKRGWKELGPYIRVGFLMEEVGEVARAVRAIEIGRDRPDEVTPSDQELHQELIGELGDVLANIALLANIYDLSLDEVVESHKQKLQERYQANHNC
ncbi:MazG nucleotide pyrophosphohydrolase domain-containing protein [Thermoflavimicrobium daqui]|uniref:NTP pyrophosphohydrolase MazG-like domain-containing protein n=1 Tax=Thermoflavimicrobium daqui TaxID=2137476 RepID=A0A364K3T7_9BACL|nr:MazG-like family protein [Thermoflavimicrobium daqui]RAL23386.1 hypothetical protein DL897_11905 [Thermoflavimicrobium daqui]